VKKEPRISANEPLALAGEKKIEIGAPPQEKLLGHEDVKFLGIFGSEKGKQEAKIKELDDRLMRLQADFENYKKRAQRENENIRENASADVMLRLLPVVDEFEIAITHMDRSSAKEFKQGMELIYSKLLDLLRKENVEPMRSLGESFDPYKHDAIRTFESDNERSGKIVEEVQKGYTYKGKVLRHAKVVVGKAKERKGSEETKAECRYEESERKDQGL
jgi:molecular chaperone GrpE